MSRSRHPAPGLDELLLSGAAALSIRLDPADIEAFRIYREEALRWSAAMNLTALRDAGEIVRAGFLDSLACLPLIPAEARRALDIGSGAGFPALPLKLARPGLQFTLVEASRKKVTFLRHIVRTLGLAEVRVVRCRAEAFAESPQEVGVYDLALARAVAPLLEQGRLVRPFLRPGGVFLAQVGPGPPAAGAPDRLVVQGFRFGRELVLPSSLGLPGRRVLALRRTERGPGR